MGEGLFQPLHILIIIVIGVPLFFRWALAFVNKDVDKLNHVKSAATKLCRHCQCRIARHARFCLECGRESESGTILSNQSIAPDSATK
jgi:hypothetical protein